MDRVTKGYVTGFRQEQSFPESMHESTVFEHFANYCVITELHDDEFDLDEVHTGQDNDLSIDGLAIVVNGVLVASSEEVAELVSMNGYLEVRFIFVQAKTASNFNSEKIGAFLDNVDEFFREDSDMPMSDKIQNARSIMSEIYDKSVKFTHGKPSCVLRFVTTGQWQNDHLLETKIKKGVDRLLNSSLFGDVDFQPYGRDELQASYQRSKNNVSAEFEFANRVALPAIQGVEQAFFGVLPAEVYLNIITDESGDLRKTIFYDNVRDYQGENPVNREIYSTLDEASGRQRFAVLNNGVTLVAKIFRNTSGNKFLISDYQVVNGCQTSHVLFESRTKLAVDTMVPIKVISTTSDEITAAIITATNRQTPVTTEDLYALSELQKKLEQFFDSYPGKKKLFYERRAKQYAAVEGIEKVRIVTKQQEVRAFGAMFLDDPHRSARYYSDLTAQVGTKIFNSGHQLEPYYTAAYAYYKLEYLFRNGALPVYYKPSRYHLLMAARYIVGGADMPHLSANKVQTYCNKICESLWPDDTSVKVFGVAIEAVDVALGGDTCTRDIVKTQGFTDAVKMAAKGLSAP